MKKITALLVAAVLTLTATIPVPAAQGPVTPAPVSSPTTGPWIVAGVGVGVLSVILRAGYIGNRDNRELTSAEAVDALLLPFFWTIYPSDFLKQPKHQRRDGSIEAGDFNYRERQRRKFQPALITEIPSYSGPGPAAPASSKPPKPGAPTVGGSGGSQKN